MEASARPSTPGQIGAISSGLPSARSWWTGSTRRARWTVQRAKLVEPVHQLRADRAPLEMAPIWPGVEGLALASNAQIYPYLLNGDSVMGFAEGVAGEVGERLELGAAVSPVPGHVPG